MTNENRSGERCDAFGKAYAGSQRQVQFYVNDQPALLDRAIEEALSINLRLDWVSPLKQESYQEYKDLAFLHVLGLRKYDQQLQAFWPSSGPRWDALACVQSGNGGVVLVEAKSHIPEMYGGGCKAASRQSIDLIKKSLARTQSWLGVDASADWMRLCSYGEGGRTRKGSLYQLANRLAHLYFFREVLAIDAWLVNLCFLDDPHSPTSQKEWERAMAEAKNNLLLHGAAFMVDVYLPAIGDDSE